MRASLSRRLPVGAETLGEDEGVHFRVWAPRRQRVELVVEGDARASIALRAEGNGYFSVHAPGLAAGARYRFRLDDDAKLYPDPASRFQPEGPHGPSQVVDPTRFRWTDAGWRGSALRGQVVYEMHIGTFTKEGTWAAATERLEQLAELGVTLLEVMPVADFAGSFGWGYDGVNLYAPTRVYGEPDDLRRFVDRAHALHLGVILDVVYNHLGPDGNYLPQFSDHYLSTRHTTDWGAGINYDDEHAGPVREYVVGNAGYWIDEFHFDGLRLDATQNIYDDSKEHVLAVIGRRVREAGKGRSTIVVAENEPQETRLVRPLEEGGYGLDALWNDDLHHTARVALTGRREAYYRDYAGSPQEFVSAIKWGYLYQGQRYAWQEQRRGSPSFGVDPARFVTFLENHDQTANTARGCRLYLSTSPGRYRALLTMILLSPGTPMLFQGEEFQSSAPFIFFADHNPDLAVLVQKGRREFLQQFPSLASEGMAKELPVPHDRAAFEACKLDWAEREKNRGTVALYKDLLTLRKSDPVFSRQRARGVDGAVIGPQAFVLRFFGEAGGGDRLLLVNLGIDLDLTSAPEPLLAPETRAGWTTMWSSEQPKYGGCGTAPVDREGAYHLLGESAVVLQGARGAAS